jgi:hypothetical protein
LNAEIDEELRMLDHRLKQLKLDYEQYFLGSRPREPVQLRSELQKVVTILLNTSIQNTAQRFKFNSINSRFQTFKRQWNETQRQIENGTYRRHVFKTGIRERGTGSGPPLRGARGASEPSLFESYRDALLACGQDVSRLTEAKLQGVLAKQESAIRSKLGCERVDFRVVVQDGKVKLKAAAAR